MIREIYLFCERNLPIRKSTLFPIKGKYNSKSFSNATHICVHNVNYSDNHIIIRSFLCNQRQHNPFSYQIWWDCGPRLLLLTVGLHLNSHLGFPLCPESPCHNLKTLGRHFSSILATFVVSTDYFLIEIHLL